MIKRKCRVYIIAPIDPAIIAECEPQGTEVVMQCVKQLLQDAGIELKRRDRIAAGAIVLPGAESVPAAILLTDRRAKLDFGEFIPGAGEAILYIGAPTQVQIAGIAIPPREPGVCEQLNDNMILQREVDSNE